MNEKETFPVWVTVSLEVWVTRPLTTIPDRIPKLQDNFNPSIGVIFHSIFSSRRCRLCNQAQLPFWWNLKLGDTTDFLNICLFKLNLAVIQSYEF